jgi:predicted dehydrogenase
MRRAKLWLELIQLASIVSQDVDAVYIGTPHTCHFLNALCALKAKKNVLCEKPVTTSVVELCFLLEVAKENGVFFMEAM